MVDENVQKVWDEFWADLLTQEDGSMDYDQLKKELSDYHMLLENMPSILMEATGGRVSKPNTDRSVVIGLIQEYQQRLFEEGYDQAMDEMKDEE
jgi:hypothetical protein